MLFNSADFLSFFLPLVVFFYFYIGRKAALGALVFLIFASFAFYARWNPKDLLLIFLSIASNYTLSKNIESSQHNAKKFLVAGIFLNLILLAYFKYTKFFLSLFTEVPNWAKSIILPLAISFYTFQQISYLVHIYQEKQKGGTKIVPSLFKYTLFISFFPHLIAGPIVRDSDFIHQIDRECARFNIKNFQFGLILFILGLAKKMLFADLIAAEVADRFFSMAQNHQPFLASQAAWAVLAYTLQIYFDFSGYSDMAIGIAAIFNFKLPINFNSPYRAVNIEDFWRRWHMTLSRFLRDYLYIPLGGNRKGEIRKNLNLLITMLLGGLWHGANWTFVLWGCLHGIFLVTRRYFPWNLPANFGRVITLICVAIAWIPFRAQTLDQLKFFLQSFGHFHYLPGEPYAYILWRYRFFLILSALLTQSPWNSQEIAEKLVDIPKVRKFLSLVADCLLSFKLPLAFALSCLMMLIFIWAFYANNIDLQWYKRKIVHSRATLPYVDWEKGSFRQNFLNTSFVRHFQDNFQQQDFRQIAIVGSSFAVGLTDTNFRVGPWNYIMSSVANNGRDISHLIRQIGMAVQFRPYAIIIAFSPYTIGHLKQESLFNDLSHHECTDAYNAIVPDFSMEIVEHELCWHATSSIFSWKYLERLPDEHKRLFQFRSFVNDFSILSRDEAAQPVLDLGSRENAQDWWLQIHEQKNKIRKLFSNNRENNIPLRIEKWKENFPLSLLDQDEEVFRILQQIKLNLKQRGIRLLLYSTPIASRGAQEYQEYFAGYQKKMYELSQVLKIPYLDLTDFLPLNADWMLDFLHARVEAKRDPLPRRIGLFFIESCLKGEIPCD